MKEYSITMTFTLEAQESDYEQIEVFAEKLKEDIIDKTNHVDIEIVDSSIVSIDDFNDEHIDMGDDFNDYEE